MILQQRPAFYSAFFLIYIHWSGLLTALTWLVPHETAAILVRSVYTIQPCHFMQSHVTSCKVMSLHAKPCHFMQSHIRKLHLCLTVTCHLHFWQNDRYLLYATAATQGWNGYRNKSQHRKLTLDKKILPPFLQVFEPTIFQSQVQHSNHWAIPAIQVHAERVYVSLPVTCHQHLWLNDQGGLQAASVTSWWKG